MIYHVTAATVTNLGRFNVVSKTPAECSEQEIDQFTDLLAEGGEVKKEGAADRVRKARSLGFAYEGSDLIGISALKHPAQSYRTSVERNAGVSLPESDFPYEIGWLYVKPEYRNPGTGNMLRYLLIQPALGIQGGCFATTRKQNVMPQRLLTRFGFEQKGHIWTSPTTGNQISLFTRDASKGALTSVTASADVTEIEAIYISSALASAIDSDRISKLAVRVPALAQVAVAACDAGYAEAGTDLMCAIAAEDGLLAAHALNFLHTELESDIKKQDPDFKIIGDIVPSEAVGIPSEEMPEPTHNLGMLFKLATTLHEARNDLPNVQLGVEPSLPHVCLEQLEGLGCPHINHVHEAIEAPKANLADAKEMLTRIDMDLRAKLADAGEVETDRIQRILINLETLMAELFQSGVALASEYVPFGDAVRKASGIRVLGIRPKEGKPGVWELIAHYNDGSSLKSIASNKRSLGLCLGMTKVGTKVNFQGTLGRTTADGMSLEDGRTVKLLEKVHQNAPVAEEATAGQSDSLGGTPVSGNSVADFRKDLIEQLEQSVAVDPTYGDIYLASHNSKTNPFVRRLALTLGVTPDKGALHVDVYVRQSTRGGWSPDAANTGHVGMYAPPAGTPKYATFVSELASAITAYISTDIRDAAGLKSFASNYSSPQSSVAEDATASDNEATAGNQVDFYDLYLQLNEHYADSNHVLFSYEKRIGTTYYVPFVTADYSTADDPKKRPVTREECLKLKHEINELLEGSGVKVDAIDRPEVLSKHKWALVPRAADGARTPKLPKEAARAANTRELLDESRALNESEEVTASTASDRLYAKIAEKVQSAKPGLKSASATVTEIAGTIIIVIQDVVLQPEALSVILNKPIKDKSKSFIRASGVEFDVERFPGKSGKAGDVSIKFDRARPKQVADALGTLKRLFDTAVSYGKSPAPLEATATETDLKSQAIGEISTSLSRLAERARNMYESISLVAAQEDKTHALVELPLKLQYEIAKSYEALSGVEALVFRQLEQGKAVIEISYKSLSDADAKEVASKFVPLYKDHKMIGFRGALFAVANSFGKEGTRQVGDVKKLASALRPACDLIEAAVAKVS